jgi:hypothetical protein
MQMTIGPGVTPAGAIFTGEASAACGEIDFRMRRLETEAAHERLAGSPAGLRRHVGHALMALGRIIHGMEPDQGGRPVLQGR